MMKLMVAAAAAAALCAPDAAAQSIVQKTDWSAKSFESYLPPPTRGVPWLEIDTRTALPRQDIPIGWQAHGLSPFALEPPPYAAWMSSSVASDTRRM